LPGLGSGPDGLGAGLLVGGNVNEYVGVGDTDGVGGSLVCSGVGEWLGVGE
jgi:hypothetical protein